MKYRITLLLLFYGLYGTAQPPQLLKYQGIARDSTDNPVSNDTVSLRISIHQGTVAGTVVYQETHSPITNQFGAFSINIGGGMNVNGDFSNIAWYNADHFQEIEMDITGGNNFIYMGTSQYLSVPYAFNSGTAFFARFADSSDVATTALNVINGGFGHLQVFNSSGIFTVPAGVTKVMVEIWGAGGGGGGGGGGAILLNVAGFTGGGGGGGGYVKDIVDVIPGANVIVTIGNGGGAGVGGSAGAPTGSDGANGSSGTNSYFGSLVANGGNYGFGGGGASVGANPGNGGAGGNAPGLLGVPGQFGQSGNYFGFGGSSSNGGFGGNPGGNKTPGGGGSGGQGQYGNGNTGTSGGDGRVVVWW